MQLLKSTRLRGLAMILASTPLSVNATSGEKLRDWSTTDSMAVRYIVGNHDHPGALSDDNKTSIVWSPGGGAFFLIENYGELSGDCVRYTLKVFVKRQVEPAFAGRAVKPARVYSTCSRDPISTSAGISGARWDGDDRIVFLAADEKARHSVVSLSLSSGDIAILSDPRHDVNSWNARTGAVVYTAISRPEANVLDRYPGLSIAGDELHYDGNQNSSYDLFAAAPGKMPKLIGHYVPARFHVGVVGISPDARWAWVDVPLESFGISEKWAAYPGFKDGVFHFPRFSIIDLANGTVRPVFDAPIGQATTNALDFVSPGWWALSSNLGFWTKDSSHVILVNTALPLDQKEPQRVDTAYIIDYDVEKGAWSVIEPMGERSSVKEISRARSVSTVEMRDDELIIHHSIGYRPSEDSIYRFESGKWKEGGSSGATARPADEAAKGDMTAYVRESANDPPVIVVKRGSKEAVLSPPDPAVADIWRAEVKQISWAEPEGRIGHGGLMLPRRGRGQQPYPLVIQAYANHPDLFRPDGTYLAGYSAQSLVAKGFAVLQIDLPARSQPELGGTAAEGPAFVARVDAAIDKLAANGIVDPSRVGLVGFSRGGYNVMYAIAHPGKHCIGAAVSNDNFTGMFSQYILDSALSGNGGRSFYDSMYGGPYWNSKVVWADMANDFNIDRVRAPVLLSIHGKKYRDGSYAQLGSLKVANKPFDYLLLPESDHNAQRPKERLLLQSSTVEWMSFWLQGKTEPQPGSLNRSKKWEGLRALAGLPENRCG